MENNQNTKIALLVVTMLIITITSVVSTAVMYGMLKEMQIKNNNQENTQLSDYFILYNGIEIAKNTGIQNISDMEITATAQSKYNTTYYNYENGEYAGTTEGRFGNETYEGVSIVENVKRIAISQNYNAIPRKFETLTELPDNFKDMLDYTNVTVQTVDLDGNGTKEFIVFYAVNYEAGAIGDGEPVASSGIMLFDNDYKKIADLATLENGFWANIKTEENKVFLSIKDVEYIDIDNDGIMEIIIDLPNYSEPSPISIVKYSNGKIEGETNIKANVTP